METSAVPCQEGKAGAGTEASILSPRACIHSRTIDVASHEAALAIAPAGQTFPRLLFRQADEGSTGPETLKKEGAAPIAVSAAPGAPRGEGKNLRGDSKSDFE
jgi:hypothetical protein